MYYMKMLNKFFVLEEVSRWVIFLVFIDYNRMKREVEYGG